MNYYRRKLLLAIIAQSGGTVDKMAFQKLLFLVCNKQTKPTYEFVPYKYGQLKETPTRWIAGSKENFSGELLKEDQNILKNTNQFFTWSTDELLHYTYNNFPYYAKNSLVHDRYITVNEDKEIYNTTIRR